MYYVRLYEDTAVGRLSPLMYVYYGRAEERGSLATSSVQSCLCQRSTHARRLAGQAAGAWPLFLMVMLLRKRKKEKNYIRT